MSPNPRVNGTAQQRCCWVSSALRASAAGYAERPTVPLPFSSGFGKGITKPFYLATRGLGSLNTQLTPSALLSAVLPSSRSVQVGATATAFTTVINTGSTPALSCEISPLISLPASFSYQTTNPATNAITGSPNTPVDIPAGSVQSFVLALTPTAPIAPTDVRLSFDCANTLAAPINSGLNTWLFSASATRFRTSWP